MPLKLKTKKPITTRVIPDVVKKSNTTVERAPQRARNSTGQKTADALAGCVKANSSSGVFFIAKVSDPGFGNAFRCCSIHTVKEESQKKEYGVA